MRTINRTLPNNLPKLHDELLAAIPALRGTPTGPGGMLETDMLLSANGSQITLRVPDQVTDTQIDTVLAAHTTVPAPPAPNSRAARIAAVKSAGTTAEQLAAVKALLLQLAGDAGS